MISTMPQVPPLSGSFAGFQPATNIMTSTTALNAHSGGSRRRIRPRITLIAGRLSERAIREPASANITPMEGKRTDSQAQPNRW